MDWETRCKCGHVQSWEHDLGGETRGCRYCNCRLGPSPAFPLPDRFPSMFKPKPKAFEGSPLWGSGIGFAESFGEGKTGVYLMAESLGAVEERRGIPLVGPAGQLTSRMVSRTPDPENGERLSLDRDFIRGNILPIKPPFDKLDEKVLGRDVYLDALARAKPLWERDLKKAKPKAILAMGNQALRALTGWGDITKTRGAAFDTEYGLVVGTYHPSYIMRGKQNLAKVWQIDLRRAIYFARYGRPYYALNYQLYPTGMEMESFYRRWVDAGRPLLAYDIETPHSKSKDDDPMGAEEESEDRPTSEDPSYTILRMSMSFEPYNAITYPWSEPFISWTKRILEELDFSCGWNSASFDNPRLEYNGCKVGGNHVDLMLLWHLLEPALPMGLKPTAAMFFLDVRAGWACKSLASDDPELYSAIDSDMTIRLGKQLIERAKAEGKWEMFLKQYVRLGVVLRGMTRRGVKTDPLVRSEARLLFEEEKKRLVEEIQGLVPLDIHPRKVYKLTEAALRKKGTWEEGRMIEVERMEPAPKPRKRPFRVLFSKVLKTKGEQLRKKVVRAFSAEEAMGMVPNSYKAEEVVDAVEEG